MKKSEMRNVFTEKVNNYLSKGYIFNTSTMSGSQGEIVHVDLTNGEEIIRIYGDSKPTFDRCIGDAYFVFVGRVIQEDAERMLKESTFDKIMGDPIWNNKLEEIEVVEFYEAGFRSDELVTKEEAEAAAEVRKERSARRREEEKKEKEVDLSMVKMFIPYLRKYKGMKSVGKKSIHGITYHRETGAYFIDVRKTVVILSRKTMKEMRMGTQEVW